MARASNDLCLGTKGDMNVLLSPSKNSSGFVGCACCTILICSTLSDVLSLKFRVFFFFQTLTRVLRLYSKK